ncbi:MAG: hypothetical protein VXZ40_05025 [Nanoarchaeota archaeon]|nr:hypothetical protein [Nanoarchaeota archaeon]
MRDIIQGKELTSLEIKNTQKQLFINGVFILCILYILLFYLLDEKYMELYLPEILHIVMLPITFFTFILIRFNVFNVFVPLKKIILYDESIGLFNNQSLINQQYIYLDYNAILEMNLEKKELQIVYENEEGEEKALEYSPVRERDIYQIKEIIRSKQKELQKDLSDEEIEEKEKKRYLKREFGIDGDSQEENIEDLEKEVRDINDRDVEYLNER